MCLLLSRSHYELWDDNGEEIDLEEVANLINLVSSTLVALRQSLPYTKVSSGQHMNYYESIVRMLECKKDEMNRAVNVQKSARLAKLAKRATGREKKQKVLVLDETPKDQNGNVCDIFVFFFYSCGLACSSVVFG